MGSKELTIKEKETIVIKLLNKYKTPKKIKRLSDEDWIPKDSKEEAIKKLKENNPDIPIVVRSGYMGGYFKSRAIAYYPIEDRLEYVT